MSDVRRDRIKRIQDRALLEQPTFKASLWELYKVDCQWLIYEIEKLQSRLDGDPNHMSTPEERRAWRLSAVRYADKLEAEIQGLKERLDALDEKRKPDGEADDDR